MRNVEQDGPVHADRLFQRFTGSLGEAAIPLFTARNSGAPPSGPSCKNALRCRCRTGDAEC